MSVGIELDKRYKVSESMIQEMLSLRASGISKRKIGKKLGITASTVTYWTNADYRETQRRKVAKKKSDNKKRAKQHNENKKRFQLEYALGYIEKEVNTYKSRKDDVIILGMSMKHHWIPYLEEKYHKGSRKLSL